MLPNEQENLPAPVLQTKFNTFFLFLLSCSAYLLFLSLLFIFFSISFLFLFFSFMQVQESELSTGQFALLTRFIDTGSVQEVWRCATLVILHISISDCTTRPQHQTCNLATCSAFISDDQDDARGPPASNTVWRTCLQRDRETQRES